MNWIVGWKTSCIVGRRLTLQRPQRRSNPIPVSTWRAGRVRAAIRFAVEFHEHVVPDLDHPAGGWYYTSFAWNLLSLFVGSRVDVDLRIGVRMGRYPYFPEIILLVAPEDTVFSNHRFSSDP